MAVVRSRLAGRAVRRNRCMRPLGTTSAGASCHHCLLCALNGLLPLVCKPAVAASIAGMRRACM